MRTLHHPSWAFLLGAIAAILGGCKAQGHKVGNAETGYIFLDTPARGHSRIPVLWKVGPISDGSFLCHVGRIQEGSIDGIDPGWEVYGGISGCPVYTYDNNLLGVIKSEFWIGERNSPAVVLPAREVALGVELGKSLGRPVTSLLSKATPQLAPGDQIAIAKVWGGILDGAVGVVCTIEDTHALVLGHSSDPYSIGPCSLALVRAPVIARLHDGGDSRVLVGQAEVLGVCTYIGERGVYARLDRSPPMIRLTRKDVHDAASESELYWISRDAATEKSSLVKVFRSIVTPISFLSNVQIVISVVGRDVLICDASASDPAAMADAVFSALEGARNDENLSVTIEVRELPAAAQ